MINSLPSLPASSISPLPFIPGIGGGVLSVFQAVVILSAFKNEVQETTRAPYSKFAQQGDISRQTSDSSKPESLTKPPKIDAAANGQVESRLLPSKVGMLIIYAPALLTSLLFQYLASSSSFSRIEASPASFLCIVHFAKRVAEVLFLHKYSGSVALQVSLQIGIYYALICLLVSSVANPTPSTTSCTIGTVLFAIGTIGNFYHHYLLASLRKQKKVKTDDDNDNYVPPNGGLFDYVAAPHYLFELIAWLGVAVASEHGNVYLVFASMASYLSGRAVAQNSWNREKFGGRWPSSRKNLVPFLF